MTSTLERTALSRLSDAAWAVREHALIIGKTKVGCAVLGIDGSVHAGCNVEQRFRSHDIHAEVNAVGNMIASGIKSCSAILVAAERERFTPCGSCMDWIMQIGGPECIVAFQKAPDASPEVYRAGDLMPYYPH
jgi:cytidine deaminase